uniref:Uncharacterized protein n=1 Tax=Brassica oleracea TaxID=3712 RepID=A0A3P6DBA9_BRAOL|nr:unnamed protein product [Brassica oleracea]
MTFVGSESLDHHPPPSPSVHGHHLVSHTQRPLLVSCLLGALFLDTILRPDERTLLEQSDLKQDCHASPYTIASKENHHQERKVETERQGEHFTASHFFFLKNLSSDEHVF